MADAYDFIIVGGTYAQFGPPLRNVDDDQLERQARSSLPASHIPQQHLQSFLSKQEEPMIMLRISLALIATMQLLRTGHQ
jgi:hypothetical protein